MLKYNINCKSTSTANTVKCRCVTMDDCVSFILTLVEGLRHCKVQHQGDREFLDYCSSTGMIVLELETDMAVLHLLYQAGPGDFHLLREKLPPSIQWFEKGRLM